MGKLGIGSGIRPRLVPPPCTLASLAGMAHLGWRPFGPGPPRSAFLSASTVILPSLAYCCWKPTRKPMSWCGMLGLSCCGGRTQVRAGIVPGAAPMDTGGARGWTLRISLCSRTVCCVPVRRPLPHIAMHIKKAPGVGTVLPHISSLSNIAVIIRIARWLSIPPRVRRGRACSAGILPLRFRGQYIRPTRRNIAGLLRIQTGEEFLDIIPGYFFHRTVSVVRPVGSAWHSAHQNSPSSPPRTGPG